MTAKKKAPARSRKAAKHNDSETRPQETFKRDLTPEQLKMVISMAGFGMPYQRIADILGMSGDTFARIRKQHATLQQDMDMQRANCSAVAHQTLFDMATNAKVGGKNQFNALKFWCQTREGFKTADRIELTGADGKPIETTTMTSEQRLAAIRELDERLGICEDE